MGDAVRGSLACARAVVLLVLACLVWLGPAGAAESGRRVALVIGNGAYRHVPKLPNPPRDAEAVAAALKAVGFDVALVLDADESGMRKALQALEDRAQGAAIALVYFAGHGLEVDGTNYIVPVDAELARDTHVRDEAISLDRILDAVSQASTLRLVLLDACRNDPFTTRMVRTSATRSIGRGLARVEPDPATLVSFAAEAGSTADDGDGAHSPYAQALLDNIATPGLELNFVFRRINAEVRQATAGAQRPVYYGSLGKDEVYLVPAAPKPEPPPPPKIEDADHTLADQALTADMPLEELYWRTIRSSTRAEDFKGYLRRFPTGAHADLAEARVTALTRAAEVGALVPGGAEDHADKAALRQAAMDRIGRLPVNMIQYGLAALGFRLDTVSGVLDAQTRRAVRDYQGSVNTAQTGELTAQETVDLILAAAAAGDSRSETTLGFMTASGVGLERDYAVARAWLAKAAAQQEPYAYVNLAMLYRDGLGGSADKAKARTLFQEAVRHGVPEAQRALDDMDRAK